MLAACLACFHLGNGAMLPLYGLAVVGAQARRSGDLRRRDDRHRAGRDDREPRSSPCGWRKNEGYWLVLLISFIALPIRGLIAAHLITDWGVYPVQMLDGVGAGLQSVAVPGLVARILNGTGRVNVGQGAVMTVQGARRIAQPGDRRLDRAMLRLSDHVHGARKLRSCFDRALATASRASSNTLAPASPRTAVFVASPRPALRHEPSENGGRTLAFAHISDPHIADARRQNYKDLLSILAQIDLETKGQIDFVVLPGDCADNGRSEQ